MDWERRGARAPRFSRLRAALTILERGDDGHHVVAYDPTERDAEGSGRRGQRRSPRGRDQPRVTRGRRVIREGEEDIDEVVRTSRKRAMKTGELSEGEGDKIQIEVGAVKGLEAKRGVKRGALWIIGLSLLLFWVPVLGPAVAGYIGGRKAGTPVRAGLAATIPIFGAFVFFTAVSSTTSVPAVVRHFVESGSAAVFGSLPFDVPILEYVLGNLVAVMRAGPDALFLLLGFAVAGGAVSEMKIQERRIPTITARVPGSRVVQPMVQAAGRAVAGRGSPEVDGLVVKLNDALARAEKERRAFEKARGATPLAHGWGRPRLGLFGRGSGKPPAALAATGEEELAPGGLDPAGRKVVAQMLASTPAGRGERRPRALKSPEVEFDLPQTIAFAAPSRGAGAEGKGAAHQYRPGKYYHIYGGSVNPVARAKLEKRLRRTHTLHAMRRGARSFAQMVEVDAGGAHAPHAPHAFEEVEQDRPRSLETTALTAEMHYDALEHLENAKFASIRHAAVPRHKVAEEDDLGGLIAHLGEGGEAVVDQAGVRDVEFGGGPMFDRRGRQRARIGGDEGEEAPHTAEHEHAKPKGPLPVAVREAIEAAMHDTAKADVSHTAKSKLARSADRRELSHAQDANVNRWLKRTMASAEAQEARAKTKPARAHEAAKEVEAPSAPQPEAPAKPEPAEHKPSARKHKAPETAPAFEITHGSTEVDSEADADEEDSPSPRRNRSASDILREIKAQKKADKDAEEGEDTARAAQRAKDEADEIERHTRESVAVVEVGEVAMAAHEKPAAAADKPSTKRRSRGDDLEDVKTDTEKLSGELELTLAPIRDEAVEIHELSEVHAEAAPSVHMVQAAAAIPQVGAEQARVEVTEVVTTAAAPEPERDVKPGDVVLAGPSTDAVIVHAGEEELSLHDQEKIRQRLQEGWNRL